MHSSFNNPDKEGYEKKTSTVSAVAHDLLAKVCSSPDKRSFQLFPLQGGRNNQVFKLVVHQDFQRSPQNKDLKFLLKLYFHHPKDDRQRLKNEYCFSDFLWSAGVQSIAQPLAASEHQHAALFDFLQGKQLQPEEITPEHISQSIAFLATLRGLHEKAKKKPFPQASEACFSLSQHLQCIEQRVQNLTRIQGQEEVDRKAQRFIANKLVVKWQEEKKKALDKLETLGLHSSFEQLLSSEEHFLSPSDFGFHNTLVDSDGMLFFIDFEYAGWDDPAKLCCDSLCQPEIPVPKKYRQSFRTKFINLFAQPEQLSKRITWLYPLYQLKWCCIALNDFLASGSARRAFSGREEDKRVDFEKLQKRKKRQLGRATQILEEFQNSLSE